MRFPGWRLRTRLAKALGEPERKTGRSEGGTARAAPRPLPTSGGDRAFISLARLSDALDRPGDRPALKSSGQQLARRRKVCVLTFGRCAETAQP